MPYAHSSLHVTIICIPRCVSPGSNRAFTLQVDKAFEYLEKYEGPEKPDVRYEIRVKRSDSAAWQRGIYLREPLHAIHPVSFTVEVTPTLHEVSLCFAPQTGMLKTLLTSFASLLHVDSRRPATHCKCSSGMGTDCAALNPIRIVLEQAVQMQTARGCIGCPLRQHRFESEVRLPTLLGLHMGLLWPLTSERFGQHQQY